VDVCGLPTMVEAVVCSCVAGDCAAQGFRRTALGLACRGQHVECVQALLDRGAGVDGACVSWPVLLLHMRASYLFCTGM
jgi:hypothetical protein